MKILSLCILLFANVYAADKVILIDLSEQKLIAKEDGKIYFTMDISSGMYGYQTPIGNFTVFAKHKEHESSEYPKREDGNHGGAKMPYTMKITKNGVAIHEGRIRRENGLAIPASHGCIRVPKKHAKSLFEWTNMMTRVFIKGKTRYVDSHNLRFKSEDALYGEKITRYSDEFGDWSEARNTGGALVYDASFAEPEFY